MKAIFASKMYKATKNKDKIKAALADPVNKELVKQLRSYLDDEYQKAEYVDPDIQSEAETTEDVSEETIGPSRSHRGDSSDRSTPRPNHNLSQHIQPEDEGDLRDRESELGTDEVDEAEIGVEESTHSSGSSINASTRLTVDIASQIDSVAGLLNSRQDTCGVCRIIVKDDEVWLHYNDNTNLNNVMEPVIALLNASDYSCLDFNRLARTENAIVFSISQSDKPVEPIKSEGSNNE